jgi:hypothetical protein
LITSAAVDHTSDSNGVTNPTPAKHATTLTFGLASPYAVIDTFFEGILEAGLGHRALGADALCCLNAHAVARKEGGR